MPAMTQSWQVCDGVLELGDLPVERGGVIRDARLAWQAHGTLNDARGQRDHLPVQLHRRPRGAGLADRAGRGARPRAAGSSWSRTCSPTASRPARRTPTDFPAVVTMADNVHAQHRLLTEHFGVTRRRRVVRLLDGRGPGLPLGRAVPRPGASARSSSAAAPVPRCTTGCSCPGCCGRWRPRPSTRATAGSAPSRTRRPKAFGHIYAGWGLSQDFYRARLFETALGAPDLDSVPAHDWEESFAANRAANLYAQALTWQEADISANELLRRATWPWR